MRIIHANIQISSALLFRNQNDPFFDRFVTCDEKWILYDNRKRSEQLLDAESIHNHLSTCFSESISHLRLKNSWKSKFCSPFLAFGGACLEKAIRAILIKCHTTIPF